MHIATQRSKIYEDRIRIVVGDAAIAQHRRGFNKHERFLDVRHFLELLQHKHRAAETALVLTEGRIPAELRALFEHYGRANPNTATKRWTRVLALLVDASLDELARTVTHALACGTDDPDVIALLLRHRRAKPPAAIDGTRLPDVAQLQTVAPNLNAYAVAVLAEGAQ